MKIDIDPKEEIIIYINKMKSHIYNNKSELKENFNSLAGHEFEKVVFFNFLNHNTFNENLDTKELLAKSNQFDLYDSVFFRENLEINAFSQIELRTPAFLKEDELPYSHILNSKGVEKQLMSMKLISFCYFQNRNRSIPIIDGGLIYNSPRMINRIITYDATDGKKRWYYENFKLETEQINEYMERYPLMQPSKLAENLIKVIAKLELTLPRTF